MFFLFYFVNALVRRGTEDMWCAPKVGVTMSSKIDTIKCQDRIRIRPYFLFVFGLKIIYGVSKL